MTRMETILTKSKLDFSIKFEDLVLILAAFFLSRVTILNGLQPFGIAFLASHIIMRKEGSKILLSSIISIFMIKGLGGIYYYISAIIIYSIFTNYRKHREFSLINSSIIASILFLAVGALYTIIFKDVFLYNFMMVGFEALLIFTMTYVFSFGMSIEKIGYGELKNEKLICTYIIFALVISGFSNIIVYDIALINLICILIVIFLSYSKGIYVGSMAGIVLGLITFISSGHMPFIISILGVGGVLAGLFKDLGKLGSLMGFVLGNTIVSFYINGLGTSFFNYREILIAGAVFIIFGSKVESFIHNNTVKEDRVKKSYEDKKFELASNKLNSTMEYLDSITEVFARTPEEINIFSKEIIYDLIKDIEENNCSKCPNHEKCWSQKYYKSYYSLFTSIGVMESGVEDSKEIIKDIFNECKDFEELYRTLNLMFNIYKKDESLKNRYLDQNKVFVEQIEALGRIIEDINLNIYKDPTFNSELEKILEEEIRDKRYDLKDLLFVQLEGDCIEVYMEFYSLNSYERTEKIIDIVSKTLGYELENNLSYGSLEKTNSLKLIKANRYNSITKISKATSDKDNISGDNFTFGRVDNIKYIGLSDGMGTGDKANFESRAAIELLERMLELGSSKEMTLRSINSILRAKSEEEIFTTLDIGLVDLYTGKLELVKSGAAPTFIKRKDHCIIINSESLPIGIFNDVEFKVYEQNLQDGDLVIMMSDGVLDANKKTSNPQRWMQELIASIDSLNPQILSDEIFNSARLANRNTIDDDMTLLVTKVWKE